MQGLRTWEEDSLGVDDSITNYILLPLLSPPLFFSKGKKFDRDSIWGRVDILMEIGIELSGRRRTVKYDMEFGYIFSLRESTVQPFSSLRYRAFPSIR